MKSYKHVGSMTVSHAKILVAFRTLPGESNCALVIPLSSLSDSYYTALTSLVESVDAQNTFEFGEILFSRTFPDGRPMLRALQADGLLEKVANADVTMTPTLNDSIVLSELNVLIAEHRSCTVDELCNFVSGAKANAANKQHQVVPEEIPTNDIPLSDEDLAKSLRSQADTLAREVESLRKQADDLSPSIPFVETAKEDAES